MAKQKVRAGRFRPGAKTSDPILTVRWGGVKFFNFFARPLMKMHERRVGWMNITITTNLSVRTQCVRVGLSADAIALRRADDGASSENSINLVLATSVYPRQQSISME